MADRPVERRLVLDSLLCFTMTKFKRVDIKRLKDAINVKYQPEDISLAKTQLLKGCSSFNLLKPLGRYPDRQGVHKTDSELNDIIDIIMHLDECQALSALPRYVSDNSDSFPSLPLDEGELSFLFAKLDKMEATIEGLRLAVNAMHTPLFVSSSALGPNAYVGSSAAGLSSSHIQSSSSLPIPGPSLPRQKTTDKQEKSTVNNTKSVGLGAATSTPVHRAESRAWSDLVAAERHHVDYSSSAGSNYGDVDADGFQRVRSPKHKRKRANSGRHQHDQHHEASSRVGSNQLIGNRPMRNSHASTTLQSDKKKPSRQPLLFGRKSASSPSNNTPTVSAAHVIKSVFLVDNLDNSCDTVSLTNFVKHLRVRVLSCFEVKPRTTRWQRSHGIIPDHRAFRVCINRADNERFLDETKWPSDVIVSTWYSMKRTDEEQHNVDSDNDHIPATAAERRTTTASASTERSSSSDADAAEDEANVSNVEPEADKTVIEIELADISMSDPSRAPTTNQIDGVC